MKSLVENSIWQLVLRVAVAASKENQVNADEIEQKCLSLIENLLEFDSSKNLLGISNKLMLCDNFIDYLIKNIEEQSTTSEKLGSAVLSSELLASIVQ